MSINEVALAIYKLSNFIYEHCHWFISSLSSLCLADDSNAVICCMYKQARLEISSDVDEVAYYMESYRHVFVAVSTELILALQPEPLGYCSE